MATTKFEGPGVAQAAVMKMAEHEMESVYRPYVSVDEAMFRKDAKRSPLSLPSEGRGIPLRTS